MDEASFEKNWMHPGFSEKAGDANAGRGATSTAKTRRVPVGEKGLGRLAAGRLGTRLEVFTRRHELDPWLHVDFEWSRFDDMTRTIDEIKIPFDYKVTPTDAPVSTGTIVVISGLTQKWEGRVPGRPAPGRRRTRLGRLNQDLGLLVRPLGATDLGFAIHLGSDSIAEEDDIGTITPETAVADAGYVYDFEFRRDKRGRVSIHRTLRRSKQIADEFMAIQTEVLPVGNLAEVAHDERRPETLESGPFRGRFFYTPPPAARRAKVIDAVGHGVLLYRDSVLVEPYGLAGDDWVGVSARKAQRQGYALVQPSTFSGHVLISRKTNPELRDMSNRQGLIENDASEEFVEHVRAEFLVFERAVFDELSRRWTSIEEKAARQSEESVDLAAVRLRAIAHSLGQPLMGLQADIASVRLIAARPDVSVATRQDLVGLADSADRHLKLAGNVIGRFRNVPVAERTVVKLDELVLGAAADVEPLAASLNVTISVESIPSHEVFVHQELVSEAIKALVSNAVEAPRRGPGFVRVSHHKEGADEVIDIRDDGAGIRDAGANTDVTSVPSTKGRPGEGLSTASAAVSASRGRVRIAETGPSGTHVEVCLPTRLGGVRSQ
jgi:signal transduction histidine kinase